MERKAHQLVALAAATVLGAAASGTALAQASSGVGLQGGADFATVDQDANGKISKSEASANKELSKQFAQLDSDKDGALNQAEFAKFEAKGEAKGSTSPTK